MNTRYDAVPDHPVDGAPPQVAKIYVPGSFEKQYKNPRTVRQLWFVQGQSVWYYSTWDLSLFERIKMLFTGNFHLWIGIAKNTPPHPVITIEPMKYVPEEEEG